MFSQRRFVLLALAALAIAIGLPFDALAHGISEADRQRMLDGGYLQYIGLGASHMLTGYDHLLFLFGVVFFLSSFKDVAKFVTVFTIGHCITLIFATYFKITWNYYLVDAIIALSVMYTTIIGGGTTTAVPIMPNPVPGSRSATAALASSIRRSGWKP